MKPISRWVAMVGVLVAGAAGAHAHLHMSVPADHSVVAEAPKQIILQFNEPVQLTSVTIQKGDDAATKLGPLPDGAAKEFSLKVPVLAAGNYVVKWRVVSDDGHVMADKLSFAVKAASK